MTQKQNVKTVHGKKRSYFFKKSSVINGEKEEKYITITASRRSKDGRVSRKSMDVFEQDLAEFMETLQSMKTDSLPK